MQQTNIQHLIVFEMIDFIPPFSIGGKCKNSLNDIQLITCTESGFIIHVMNIETRLCCSINFYSVNKIFRYPLDNVDSDPTWKSLKLKSIFKNRII